MASGSKPLQTRLARAHADAGRGRLWLPPFDAARAALAAGRGLRPVLALPHWRRWTRSRQEGHGTRRSGDAVLEVLGGDDVPYQLATAMTKPPPLDPRWLDLGGAARAPRPGPRRRPARPRRRRMRSCRSCSTAELEEAKKPDDFDEIVTAMVTLDHPEATDASDRRATRSSSARPNYLRPTGICELIPELPQVGAFRKLEARRAASCKDRRRRPAGSTASRNCATNREPIAARLAAKPSRPPLDPSNTPWPRRNPTQPIAASPTAAAACSAPRPRCCTPRSSSSSSRRTSTTGRRAGRCRRGPC